MPAPQQQPGENRAIIPRFKGINERLKFVNPDSAEFDILTGYIQQTAGVIERAPGIFQYQQVTGKVLSIYQTFDARRNVLVQTDQGLLLFSEDELFNRASTSNLIPVTIPNAEEEDMAQALLAHTTAAGVNGGIYTTASVWQIAPINQIIHQLNPDGSAAAFVTALAANIFTLAAGVYRFRIKTCGSDNNGTPNFKARLWNVTAGAAAWVGLQNAASTPSQVTQDRNAWCFIEGTLNLAIPTQLRIDHIMSSIANDQGFGVAYNTGSPELYRLIEILKTA